MFPIINIGPLAIQAPGLILLAGIWLGLLLSEKYIERYNIPSKIFNNLVFLYLISGLLGARLFYVIQYFDIFFKNPLSIISINPNLFDIWGGVFCAFFAGFIYGSKNGLSLWRTLDALTPILAVLSIAIGMAELATGSHFGFPTNLPWGVELWGQIRHPVQIYHIIGAASILFLLWPGRNYIAGLLPGVYFLFFISISSAFYIFISGFRAESSLVIYGFRTEQIIAWMIMAACLYKIKLIESSKKFDANNI